MSVDVKDPKKAAGRNEAEGFPFRQSRLPNRLGVSIEVIREAREHLEEGVDWKQQGQVVLFSAGGVERLGERLKVMGEERTEGGGLRTESRRVMGLLPERAGSLLEVGEAFLVRTMRCHFDNRHLVEVKVDGLDAGTRGFMKVKSSENFLPGMLCWARVLRGQAVWLFCGRGDRPSTTAPACPRFKGKF